MSVHLEYKNNFQDTVEFVNQLCQQYPDVRTETDIMKILHQFAAYSLCQSIYPQIQHFISVWRKVLQYRPEMSNYQHMRRRQ